MLKAKLVKIEFKPSTINDEVKSFHFVRDQVIGISAIDYTEGKNSFKILMNGDNSNGNNFRIFCNIRKESIEFLETAELREHIDNYKLTITKVIDKIRTAEANHYLNEYDLNFDNGKLASQYPQDINEYNKAKRKLRKLNESLDALIADLRTTETRTQYEYINSLFNLVIDEINSNNELTEISKIGM